MTGRAQRPQRRGQLLASLIPAVAGQAGSAPRLPALAHIVEKFTLFWVPPESRKIIYAMNAVESLKARFRQAIHQRGNFPNEQEALNVLYLVIRTPQIN